MPASAPANGPEKENHLHANLYPNTAAPGQTHECEAGNVRYEKGVTRIGNVPGNQGTDPDQSGQGGERLMGRLPERDIRAAESKKRLIKWRPSNTAIAIIFLLIFTVGPYLAFTKHIPFTGYGYELSATFSNSANISKNSPVRIAGVDVGKVIKTEADGDATKVTFTVGGSGRPIHNDAYAVIKPRIFLEGNFFIELDPGSPSAPEMDSGETIPVSRTSTAVQIDEIFNSLQSPVRADFSRALEAFGGALSDVPTAAEDATQLPEVKGKTGAAGLNGALRYGGPAGRYGAQVADALLGNGPQDLPRLVAGTGRTFGAFVAHEADLQGLIDNFNTFTGALAAQSENLSETIRRFAPALSTSQASLASLNRTLPPLRAWAIEIRPAIAKLPGLINAGEPWTKQAYAALSQQEGGGIAQAAGRSDAGARRSRPGRQGDRPAAAEPDQPLHSPRAGADLRPDDQRSLQHRRAGLPRVPLLADPPQRPGPELRRQRLLPPRPAGWRQPAAEGREPAGRAENRKRILRPLGRRPDRPSAAARRPAAEEARSPLWHATPPPT